jgi:hypothetical protein
MGSQTLTELFRGRFTIKTPRKYGGYFRKESDHRDFVSIGTAAGVAALLCLLFLTCRKATPSLKSALPISVDILPLMSQLRKGRNAPQVDCVPAAQKHLSVQGWGEQTLRRGEATGADKGAREQHSELRNIAAMNSFLSVQGWPQPLQRPLGAFCWRSRRGPAF